MKLVESLLGIKNDVEVLNESLYSEGRERLRIKNEGLTDSDDYAEVAEILDEVSSEMKDLLSKAIGALRSLRTPDGRAVLRRAESYWYRGIENYITSKSGSATTIAQTIDELNELIENESEDEDEDI